MTTAPGTEIACAALSDAYELAMLIEEVAEGIAHLHNMPIAANIGLTRIETLARVIRDTCMAGESSAAATVRCSSDRRGKEKTPRPGGNQAQGDKKSEQIGSYAKAQAAFKLLRSQPGFDERDFLNWDADKFIQSHGITLADLAKIRSDARPRARADRFEWLQAVSQHRKIKLRALRVAVALFSFANERGYCWPSQRTIARSIGYADTINSAREIRGAIADLAAIGSIEVLKLPHLPEELADKAMRATTAGGSGRNCRGKAYALVWPEQWKEKASQGLIAPVNTGADCPSITTSSNPDVLAHDSTYTEGSSSESLMTSSTLQILGMEGKAA